MKAGYSVSDAAAWSGGEIVRGNPDLELRGASIDTRSLEPGALFVAIAGPNHDAHDFLPAAQEAGAAALLVERGRPLDARLRDDLPVVGVTDTTASLGAVAAGHRARFDGPVVAITGSSGKTTTKEMCAAILEVGGACLKTPGNLNNQFGLPLTLLGRRVEDRAAVVEMGMNQPGEIAQLAAIARPTVSLVTNIGTAHIEYLGSQEAIAEEKGALFAALDEDGIAVVNADDPRVLAQAERATGRTLTFGQGEDADVRADRIEFDEVAGFEFHLWTPWGEAAVHVAGLGEHTVINALAASAAALAAGAPVENVRLGLAGFHGVAGRMAPHALPGDITLIDDTYNANPESMRAALESLARRTRGRSVAVLGDMAELGDTGEAAHRAAGHAAAELGIDWLLTLGERSALAADAARESGLHDVETFAADEHEQVVARLRTLLKPGDWVLVKGSRSMKMERIVEALRAGEIR